MAEKPELRRFGLLLGLTIIGLFALILPWLFDRPSPSWPWWIGGLFLAWGWLWPSGLSQIHRLWLTLGERLGQFNTRLILVVTFFVILTPMGLLIRLFNRLSIERGFDPDAVSYRRESRRRKREDLEKPF